MELCEEKLNQKKDIWNSQSVAVLEYFQLDSEVELLERSTKIDIASSNSTRPNIAPTISKVEWPQKKFSFENSSRTGTFSTNSVIVMMTCQTTHYNSIYYGRNTTEFYTLLLFVLLTNDFVNIFRIKNSGCEFTPIQKST